MAGLIERIRGRFAAVEPLPAGFYHYQSPSDDPLNYRLHLRLEPDGQAVLIVNASTVLHLNQTAAEYAYHLVNRHRGSLVAEEMARRYRVRRDVALQDFRDLRERVETLITTPDLDPILFLDFERHEPYSHRLSAPYRLDCALTYHLPEGVDPGEAPGKRVDRELSTEEWKSILEKAWQAGVPHILFTGGEPTLREDLAELISRAEDQGQVTGLLTDGLRLSDASYLNTLLQAGLDHAMIVLQPDEQQSWESLAGFSYWAKTLEEDIFVAAHLTLRQDNVAKSFELLDRLAEGGVSAVSLSTNDDELTDALQEARSHADNLDLPLIWDMPVPYSTMNPVALELADQEGARIDGAGQGWLYVEPDGDVLPGQGINQVLGNLLRDDWENIWEQSQRNGR